MIQCIKLKFVGRIGVEKQPVEIWMFLLQEEMENTSLLYYQN